MKNYYSAIIIGLDRKIEFGEFSEKELSHPLLNYDFFVLIIKKDYEYIINNVDVNMIKFVYYCKGYDLIISSYKKFTMFKLKRIIKWLNQ